jgi:23S rRNA (uridine2479-2'-O)-methyltransferase
MPKVIKIHSENDVFQNIETLKRNREKRNKLKQFLIEGVRNINNALEYNWKINSFVYSSDKKLSGWASDILKGSKAETHYELPFKLLQKLSSKEDTSEILATVEIPKDDLHRIPLQNDFLVVVFDRPASPGNLGTLIRSSDALGANGLVITGHAVDVYDPETVSATTGSLFSVPVIRLPSQKELLVWVEKVKEVLNEVQIIGTDEKGSKSAAGHDFKKPTILLVGNETSGLSAAYKEMCDEMVKIPMHGSASSLNVACASSIILYEIDRQRRVVK